MGPMYSGKSEELIRRMRRAQIAGAKVRAFKPQIDDRYEVEYIKSHNGTEFECIPVFESGKDILMGSRGYNVIGIDEAQFFTGHTLTEEVIPLLIERDKSVIVAGLDMTYRQQPWSNMAYLMAIADHVDKFSAICHRCGAEAMYTQRLIDDAPAPFTGPTVLVGATESYEARCRTCFERG